MREKIKNEKKIPCSPTASSLHFAFCSLVRRLPFHVAVNFLPLLFLDGTPHASIRVFCNCVAFQWADRTHVEHDAMTSLARSKRYWDNGGQISTTYKIIFISKSWNALLQQQQQIHRAKVYG